MQPVIYADLRCLQDKDYQHRGIGHHTSSLLRSRGSSVLSSWKTVGLLDPRMPELPSEFASLVDEVTCSLNPPVDEGPVLFIDGSPMTHDPRFSLRFQNHPAFISAAVLYDFIPLDWPGYLPSPAKRIEYVAKLARLQKFDLFFPISQYTAWRLSELTGASGPRVKVTGACVRRSLFEIRDRMGTVPSPYDREEPYFVTLGGDDRRKNTEAAVRAVRHLNLIYGRRIPLKVIGFYSIGYKSELLQLAGHAEGAGFLEFFPSSSDEPCAGTDRSSIDRWTRPSIPDEEVVALHAGAIAAIAPSHIEGFSLPVAEASVCGCPVIASTCAAQMELVKLADALFQSDDAAALSGILERLLEDHSWRASLLASQSHLGPIFHEEEVGARFWEGIASALENRYKSAAIAPSGKLRLAFLSPYPPDQSDAALYTAMTIQAGNKFFNSDIYTDAPRPLSFESTVRDAGQITLAPLLDRRYSGIISVLGNSTPHSRILDVFERFGGPCILHDVRLIQIYFERLGAKRFVKFASELLGRAVSLEEVQAWLQDSNLPFLFLERVIERASPLIVHTKTQQALLKKHYGVEAKVTTCCPTMSLRDAEFSEFAKRAVRERRRIPDNVFIVSSFGEVSRIAGMDTCILAVELLRSWNISAELYFVGDSDNWKQEIDTVSALYGVSQQVHSGADLADSAAYRDFLIASDAAVQLRSYAFGHLSNALTNCIAAGLSSVASSDLANACDAPPYVLTVPDRFSPLQVAEQLALIWEAKADRDSHSEARAAYLATHNFEYYSKRLIEILGIA
jgi:glycosyltransferase involved in cell wall biosynthesis